MLKKTSVLFLEFKKFLNSQQANQSVETYIIHKFECFLEKFFMKSLTLLKLVIVWIKYKEILKITEKNKIHE